MGTKNALSLLLVLCVAGFISFFYLGQLPLLDPDEPVYAETAREMIQFNDYISPRIFNDFWYDKPPMYYWLVAGAFKLFGAGEFGARFPSALLGVSGTVLIYLVGRGLFGNRAGMLAALVLTTSLEYFYLSKAAVTDITLTFFMAVSLLAFLKKRYYLFYGCAALAVLTKGPIGIVFPGIIIFIYLMATRRLAEVKKMKLFSGTLLFLAVALPWYAIMYQYHGWDFISTFLGFHNVTRFLQPEHPSGMLWYYYIPVLFLGFFPWSVFMVQALYRAITRSCESNRPALLFLSIWAGVVFLFFSVSQTKLISYILPMYPPLALITGWYIDKIWSEKNQKSFLLSAKILTLLVILLEGTLLYTAKESAFSMRTGIRLTSITFLVMLITVWGMNLKGKYQNAIIAKVAGMILFSVALMTNLFPAAAASFSVREFSGQFMEQYNEGQAPVYITKFYHPGFMFYTNVPGTELNNISQLKDALQYNQNAYYVIRKTEYDQLAPADKTKLVIVNEQEDKLLLLQP
ncbi:MAG: glycosyltransferase family 39 protein [Veillonellales bacterium]